MYNSENELITIEELCECLLIGRNTAYKLLSSNAIKAFRIGKTLENPTTVCRRIHSDPEQAKKRRHLLTCQIRAFTG